jgi:hypothetical protein
VLQWIAGIKTTLEIGTEPGIRTETGTGGGTETGIGIGIGTEIGIGTGIGTGKGTETRIRRIRRIRMRTRGGRGTRTKIDVVEFLTVFRAAVAAAVRKSTLVTMTTTPNVLANLFPRQMSTLQLQAFPKPWLPKRMVKFLVPSKKRTESVRCWV